MLFFLVPLVLLYHSDTSIALRDRLYYLWQTLSRSAPFMLLYRYFHSWQQTHEAFLVALGVALVVNMFVGVAYHLRQRTFSLSELLKKSAQMLGVIAAVYILLAMLKVPLAESHTGELFEFALFFIVIESLHYPSGGILAMSEDEDIFDSLTYGV